MAQFCRQCGTQIDDIDLFCPRCGTKVKPIPSMTQPPHFEPKGYPVENTEVENSPKPEPVYNCAQPVSKKKGTRIGSAIKKVGTNPLLHAALMAVVILVVGFSILSKKTVPYQASLEQYMTAIYCGQSDGIDQLVPDEVWTYHKKESDQKKNDLISSIKQNSTLWADHYVSETGGKAECTFSVKDEEEVSSRKSKELAEQLEDKYGINSDQVKECYQLDLDITFTGNKSQLSWTEEFLAVKIGDQWYMLKLIDRDTKDVIFLAEKWLDKANSGVIAPLPKE